MEVFELVGAGLAAWMLHKKQETYVASTHILLSLDVIVDNLEKESALLSDCLDNVFERFLVKTYCVVNSVLVPLQKTVPWVEFLTFHYSRRIHRHHGVVGPAMLIPFHRH